MLIGVPAETENGESRVAATPETIKKLVAQGHQVRVQSGAGIGASVTDAAFADAGAELGRLKTANQGVIQIFGDSGGDYDDSSSRVKRLRVVSTFEYELN